MAVAYRTNSFAQVYLSFVSGGTVTNTGTITNGDYVVMIIGASDIPNPTLPAGFTAISPNYALANGHNIRAYGKFAFNEPATYPVTVNGGAGPIFVASYSGVNTESPVSSVVALSATGTSPLVWGAITAPANGSYLIQGSVLSSTQSMGTLPSGFTCRQPTAPGLTPRGTYMDKAIASSGSQSGTSWAFTSGDIAMTLGIMLTPSVVAPVNITQPSITATSGPRLNQSVSASVNDWLGVDDEFYIVWKRDGTAI